MLPFAAVTTSEISNIRTTWNQCVADTGSLLAIAWDQLAAHRIFPSSWTVSLLWNKECCSYYSLSFSNNVLCDESFINHLKSNSQWAHVGSVVCWELCTPESELKLLRVHGGSILSSPSDPQFHIWPYLTQLPSTPANKFLGRVSLTHHFFWNIQALSKTKTLWCRPRSPTAEEDVRDPELSLEQF